MTGAGRRAIVRAVSAIGRLAAGRAEVVVDRVFGVVAVLDEPPPQPEATTAVASDAANDSRLDPRTGIRWSRG
jgi:hypothetical protein